MMKRIDTPLRAIIKDDKLIIEIGLDTLKFAAEHCPRFYEYDRHPNGPPYEVVVDTLELAHDVIRALTDEAEDGSSPLTELLDDMFVAARDDGSIAFKENDDEI